MGLLKWLPSQKKTDSWSTIWMFQQWAVNQLRLSKAVWQHLAGVEFCKKGAHCFCISNWLKASCCPRLEQLNYLPLWWPDLDVTSILLSDLLMWAEQSKVSPFLFRRKMDPPVISFWSCILWILRCPGPAAQYAHLCALLFFTRMLFLSLAAWRPQRTKWRVVWGCFLRFSIQKMALLLECGGWWNIIVFTQSHGFVIGIGINMVEIYVQKICPPSRGILHDQRLQLGVIFHNMAIEQWYDTSCTW